MPEFDVSGVSNFIPFTRNLLTKKKNNNGGMGAV